jgi:3-hydroxybutyryl-CoA dehydrogenase
VNASSTYTFDDVRNRPVAVIGAGPWDGVSRLMAEKVRDKTRLCNTHFYMPPDVNGLDLMSDGETDRALLDTLLAVLPEFGVYPFEARKECTGSTWVHPPARSS